MRKIEKKNTYAHQERDKERERERYIEDSKKSTSKKLSEEKEETSRETHRETRKTHAIIVIMNKFIDNNDIIISAQNDTIT